MVIGDVLEHTLDGVARRVALAVIAPPSGAVGRHIGQSVRQAAAQRLVAVGHAAFVVMRIEMSVRQVKNLSFSNYSKLFVC